MIKQKINLKKELKRWGNNLVVVFASAEERVYNLSEGDIVDISDLVKIKTLPKNQTIKDIKKEIRK